MPYDAAKALAATFCWRIRHALVPLFGLDFIDACVCPTDPAFKRFSIDERVVRLSARQVESWTSAARSLHGNRSRPASLHSGSRPSATTHDVVSPKSLRPRRVRTYQERDAPGEHESDALASPDPKQLHWPPATRSRQGRAASGVHHPASSSSSTSSSSSATYPGSPRRKRSLSDVGERSADGMVESPPEEKKRRTGTWSSDEERVAYVLTHLRFTHEHYMKQWHEIEGSKATRTSSSP